MKDEERGAKRPNSANRSEYTLANNEDERIVKKPKLMEPSTTSSKNPETEELKVPYCSCMRMLVGGDYRI